ncbi:MAG: hypothetical protein IJU77_11610 [Butyrivibrio sp.]|nr:hypothetical protein [Butyrivibrio sp.]
MSTQVQWGKLKFNVNGRVAHGVKSFAASLKMKDEGSKCKKKYSEPEEVSFSITTHVLAGGNPLNDYDFLKSYVGQKGHLKVNETYKKKLDKWRAGGAKFKLEKVEMSNAEMDNYGRIVKAEIKLNFIEQPTKKTGKKSKVKKKIRKPAEKMVKGKWK